jgi:2-amino-4-hydroxy-6-hydroxymethyldihydropteridine diphosphokinase
MILIGLGANLASEDWGSPRNTLEAALAELAKRGVHLAKLSRWYETAPVPVSDQPNFVNAVAAVTTDLPPEALLALLHRLEHSFGRVRRSRWEARVIDLDLLAYDDLVLPDALTWLSAKDGLSPNDGLTLPHPRLHQRRFVLAPLQDVAPDWRHPVLGLNVGELLADLSGDEAIRPMPGEE